MRLAILSCFIFLNACGHVKIHDDPFCADAGRFGAECFYTLSGKQFSLDKFQWDRLRVGQICSATENPGEGYKNLKNAIEKLCADSNRCTPEEIQMLQNIMTWLDSRPPISESALDAPTPQYPADHSELSPGVIHTPAPVLCDENSVSNPDGCATLQLIPQ